MTPILGRTGWARGGGAGRGILQANLLPLCVGTHL